MRKILVPKFFGFAKIFRFSFFPPSASLGEIKGIFNKKIEYPLYILRLHLHIVAYVNLQDKTFEENICNIRFFSISEYISHNDYSTVTCSLR